MFYKIMLTFVLLLMPVNWALAEDLGNEKVAGIYLNMTVEEAKKALEAQEYTEVSRKINVITFEKGNYYVHVSFKGVQSRGLPKPDASQNLLTGIVYIKNTRDLVYKAEKHDVAFCEIVPPVFDKYCSDEKTSEQGKCIKTKDAHDALLMQFDMLQKGSKAASKDDFHYSAHYAESSSHLCQISLVRKQPRN